MKVGETVSTEVLVGLHPQELAPASVDEEDVSRQGGHGDELTAVLDEGTQALGRFLGARRG